MNTEQENKKKENELEIAFEGVSQKSISDLRIVLSRMELLLNEIALKIDSISKWREKLKKFSSSIESAHDLTAGRTTSVDEISERLESYAKLLEKIGVEIFSELKFFKPYTTEEPPKTIKVEGSSPEIVKDIDLEKLISHKIVAMRKSLKTTEKDLKVSFSRYEHGLSGQLRHLEIFSEKE